jgi:hypothetical protein
MVVMVVVVEEEEEEDKGASSSGGDNAKASWCHRYAARYVSVTCRTRAATRSASSSLCC